MSFVESRPTGCRIRVRAQPRASRTEIAGPHGSSLKIRIAAPPVDGAANHELLRFLAKTFGIARARVTLVKGDGSRDKVVELEGVTADEAEARVRG